MKHAIIIKTLKLLGIPGFFLMLITTGSTSFAQNCPGNDVIEDPADFIWTYHPVTANNPEAYYSGVMEVGEVTLTFNNGETLTTRAYRQKGTNYSVPGPTITMQPGSKYILRLENTLPYSPLDDGHNIFKDPNVVNIHTHGLHISGESPGDDVGRSFEGQRGGDFVWDIPEDHMGGTFWYHAHHHGSTLLQVAGGMFGMLIIDDSNDGLPANVAGMEEKVLAIGFVDPNVSGTGGDQLISGSLSPTWTVNGTILGNICLPDNTWQHWRVLIADRAAKLRDVEFGPGIEVKVMGRDGVWRTEVPKDLPSNTLMLTGASRADFAIRLTTSSSWIKVGNTTVANIYSDGSSDPTVNPYDTDGVSPWNPIRPSYLRDLSSEPVVHSESVSLGARTVGGSNYSGKFNPNTPNIIRPATDIQEWSLSGNVNHPFHLHVYHVQAMEDDRDFEAGEYYDVVASQMAVRFDLDVATSTPYEGKTIMHCHILSHEDQGAMGWLEVQGGAGPPTFPDDGDIPEPYSEYYTLGGGQNPPSAPSNLQTTVGSSSAIDLTWNDNSSDEDGFDIERSTDGTNFSYLTSVGVDVTTHTDNGLSPSTTYWYRLNAYNSAGSSATSNVASATTEAGGGSVMHIENITVAREALNGNRFRGVATVVVFDDMGTTVSGATVTGDFTGPNSSTRSGTTDANGEIVLYSQGQKNPVGEWCYEVTNVTKPGDTYDSGTNVVTQACESGPVLRQSQQPIARYLTATPNPFQYTTHFSFQLMKEADIDIEVYSVHGQRVAVIANQYFEAGRYTLKWDSGHIEAGTYIVQLKTDNQLVNTQKLVLIR